MRVSLSYPNFKARLLVGGNVYYCENPGSFIAMYVNAGMPCMYVDASKPGTFDVDFPGALPVVSLAE